MMSNISLQLTQHHTLNKNGKRYRNSPVQVSTNRSRIYVSIPESPTKLFTRNTLEAAGADAMALSSSILIRPMPTAIRWMPVDLANSAAWTVRGVLPEMPSVIRTATLCRKRKTD